MSDTDTDTTARPDLEAIGKRAEAATMGPWLYAEGIYKHYVGSPDAREEFGICLQERHWRDGNETNARNNALFIAEARTDVPALIAYALRIEAEIALYRATLPTEASGDHIAANLSQAVGTEAQKGKGE